MKKSLGLILAALTLSSAFAGCNAGKYKGDSVDGYDRMATVSSNGGFAVEKGDYIYFINAQEKNDANNKYGEVVKGALMCISKTDLANGDNSNVKTIVPSLLVSQNMDAGVFIYDNYVYYATPTTDKNLTGEVEYTYIDFKRAPLDGSSAPEDYLVRLSDNTANYRFVKADPNSEVVYCLYEEKDEQGNVYLKSYNVSSEKTTTLVKGAAGQTFYYDAKNPENPNVYYTMGVTFNADTDNPTGEDSTKYNQLFCVNAATEVEVDTKAAKYTIKNGTAAGRSYDFDEKFMADKNAEAKKNKEKTMPYDLKDYTTYPYVNLGTAVLDGIGMNHVNENVDSRYVWDTEDPNATERLESDGYKYTIKNHQNGGIYFTRQSVATLSSPGEDTSLYYLDTANIEWGNSIGMNSFDKVAKVATNTANTDSALLYVDKEDNQHYYIYLSGSEVMRATYQAGATKTVKLFTTGASDTVELLMLDETNDFLYYYTGSGNQLARINYDGTVDGTTDDYSLHFKDDAAHAVYQPTQIPAVKVNKSWYKPEIFGDSLLFAGAYSYGASSETYYYIHTALLGDAAALKARVEKYDKVQEALNDYSKDLKVNAAIQYYYQTGERTEFDNAKQTYTDKYNDTQLEKIETFIAKFATDGELEGCLQKNFVQLISKMKDSDAEAIEKAWVDYFAEETEEEEKEKFPVWAIVLICVGGALLIAAGVTIPLVIMHKKKKAAALEAEATVNAYKRKKIDTTDDKTIDVYADETQPAAETAEKSVETPEEPAEEPAPEADVAEETQDNE